MFALISASDTLQYIEAINHPGIDHINGDVYHMLTEESHIGEALLPAGKRLVNLHLADSNHRALGEGSLDLDTIIMVLYLKPQLPIRISSVQKSPFNISGDSNGL